MILKFFKINEANMPNGRRCLENIPLTQEEVDFLKGEIRAIDADESIFVFNEFGHLAKTCYSLLDDKIFVGRDVFPNIKMSSSHPRDLLTPRAFLACEYYGHRHECRYYLPKNKEIKSMPCWKNRGYASINAALVTPNINQSERASLVRLAGKCSKEYGQTFALTKELKDIMYGIGESDGK